MNKNKRYFLIITAGLALALAQIACDDPPAPTATPTTQPLNEVIVETAEDVLEKTEEAQSGLCTICLLGGVPEDCTGVCK